MHVPVQEREGFRNDDPSILLLRTVPDGERLRVPIQDVRTCSSCGRTTSFLDAGPGGWAACGVCGALA